MTSPVIIEIIMPRKISGSVIIFRLAPPSKNADKKRAYVIYPNGLKKQVRSFLFFKKYPRIIPGSEIIVPPKPEKNNRTNVAEIVGYSTSLVSIIALIKSF